MSDGETLEENITGYLREETRGFGEHGVTDVDLLVFSAIVYFEFECFDAFSAPGASVRLGDLTCYAPPRAYVEHDCNPGGMEPLAAAVAESPRLADVRLERFSCEVARGPAAIQFGAACFRIPTSADGSERVVVAFRGTDLKLVGWQENFEMCWRETMPGQGAALRYLHAAAAAYPEARLFVCGHSKGGAEAEYAAVFANDALAARIERAVSFDGPSLCKCGGWNAAPDLAAYDVALSERYAKVRVPITRYVFPSQVGLLLERRDPRDFVFLESTDPNMQHNVCTTRVVDGSFVPYEPTSRDLAAVKRLDRNAARLSPEERCLFSGFVIAACERAGITVDLYGDGVSRLLLALAAHYFASGLHDRARIRRIFAKLLM